jgi:hypothetical protein
MPWIFIREVFGSSFDSEFRRPDWSLSRLFSVPPGKCWVSISLQELSNSLFVCHSTIWHYYNSSTQALFVYCHPSWHYVALKPKASLNNPRKNCWSNGGQRHYISFLRIRPEINYFPLFNSSAIWIDILFSKRTDSRAIILLSSNSTG